MITAEALRSTFQNPSSPLGHQSQCLPTKDTWKYKNIFLEKLMALENK